MDLESMKYAELRDLAKQLGLKANMKADKLLKAIKKHNEREKDTENKIEAPVANVTAEVKTDESTDAVWSSSVFVNTRRGKAQMKRLGDEVFTSCPEDTSVNVPPSEVDPQVHPENKRRRLSTQSKTEKEANKPLVESSDTSSQVQSDSKDEEGNDNVPIVKQAGKIPRYKGRRQVNRAALKPVTPNFQKLHEAQFNKMESIDAYMQRRNNNNKMEPIQEPKVAKPSRVSLFSPAPYRKNPLTSNKPNPQIKVAEKTNAVFKPSVLSTRRINVRFSELMPDNEYKRSLVKTPARKSLALATSTPSKQTPGGRKTSTAASFVFTGNTSVTPGTQKKPVFDLKASLSRPLTYKPHTGKLKPLGDCKENKVADKSLVADSRIKNYKQHRMQTREERQAKQVEDRKAKKSNLLCARRGLVMD
ncbi:nucleolar and spindle-associated protein 1 [Syngnathus scovelli]|uniref:nucleolar and spindle-associated protein 1 n=1 Tax=Syngnathus scovelli TaxID=161590 RepID=UPI00211014F5|nr:nucleolar and spindle-associated protein 1 [Syngnathus scovelli]